LNQDTLRTTPTDTFLKIARKTGFQAVELTIDKVEPIIAKGALDELRRQIQTERLDVASINGPENFNLLSDGNFQSILNRSKKLASAAQQIGCNLLVPVPSTATPGLSKIEIISQTVEALRRLAEVCGDDVNLGLEFLGMRSCSINKLETAAEVIRQVRRPNVGLVVDSFHMHASGSSFSEITGIIDKILLIHVNDSEPGNLESLTDANRVFPGEGTIDLRRFRQVLRENGYDGYVSLELLKPAYWQEDPEKIARKGRESLERIFGS
jgi:2-keto-myo-inositol isomerase